jgi:hypothetical protein
MAYPTIFPCHPAATSVPCTSRQGYETVTQKAFRTPRAPRSKCRLSNASIQAPSLSNMSSPIYRANIGASVLHAPNRHSSLRSLRRFHPLRTRGGSWHSINQTLPRLVTADFYFPSMCTFAQRIAYYLFLCMNAPLLCFLLLKR